MNADQPQLQQLSLALEATQAELRGLQQAQRRHVRRANRFRGACLAAMTLAVAGIWLPKANVQAGTVTATNMQMPVLFKDASGHTMLEISDRPQHHGITLYGKTGEAVYIGVDKEDNGMVMLETPAGKLSTEMSVDGFKYFGAGGKSVAFMGGETTGSGVIQLKNASDGVIVDIGALGGKTGFVQVYPRSGKSPFPIPNYLKGGK